MALQVAAGIIIAVGVLGLLATIGEAIDKAFQPGRQERQQRRLRKGAEKEAARQEWLKAESLRRGVPNWRG